MGGLEALAFGVLLLVFGTVVVVNAWAVVDGKFAATAAAREAVRAVTRADPAATAGHLEQVATAAAEAALAAHGYTVPVRLEEASLSLHRCATVTVTVGLRVRAVAVPGLVDGEGWQVRARAMEVVEPFRAGLDGDGVADCEVHSGF